MDWSHDDIAYSVRRYLAAALGQPWTFDFERRELTNDERPKAVIDLGPSRTTRARVSVPQGNVEQAAPMTVTLYPAVGETPRAASRAAKQVRHVVHRLLDFGLDLGNGPTGRPRAGPRRIPLYDYAAVPDSGGAGPAEPYDWLWVDDGFTVRDLQDPVDNRRYAVVAEATLTWEAAGRTYGAAEQGPVVADVPGGWVDPDDVEEP